MRSEEDDDDADDKDEDVDFMASDSPPDECESVHQERLKRLAKSQVNSNSEPQSTSLLFQAYPADHSRIEISSNNTNNKKKVGKDRLNEELDEYAQKINRLKKAALEDEDDDEDESDADDDRSAYSSIGQKIANSNGVGGNQKNDLIVLDYENLSGMSGGGGGADNHHQEEEKTSGAVLHL